MTTGHDDDRAAKLYGPKPGRHPLNKSAPNGRAGRHATGVVQLSKVTARPVRWLWPGRIPADKLTIVDGDPGTGKSTVTLDWAARITTGRPWPDGEDCPRGNVLLMTAEDGIEDTVLPRLEVAGGNPDRVRVLSYVETDQGRRPPAFPGDVPEVTDAIRQARARLLIVDVLAAYWDATVNTHRDTEVRRALSRLSDMATAADCAVVCLRHLNKADGKNALYRGGGSIGITGHARAVHLAALDPDDPRHERRILAPVKCNLAKLPPPLAYSLASYPGHDMPRVIWLGEDTHTAAALLDAPPDPDDRDDQDEAVEWLLDYLRHAKDRRAPYAEILAAARKHSIAERTLKRARRRAGIPYMRTGWQAGTVWALDAALFGDEDQADEEEAAS